MIAIRCINALAFEGSPYVREEEDPSALAIKESGGMKDGLLHFRVQGLVLDFMLADQQPLT